jgi:hypothetical protein
MNATFKKLTVAAALASLVAAGSVAAATPAAAGWGWRHGGGWGYHGGWGVPVAAGLLGALTVGAIASAASQPAYYGGRCYMANRPISDAWGNFVGYRPVRVCD